MRKRDIEYYHEHWFKLISTGFKDLSTDAIWFCCLLGVNTETYSSPPAPSQSVPILQLLANCQNRSVQRVHQPAQHLPLPWVGVLLLSA